MGQLVLTLAVDYATPGKAIGIKEAIAMDLENAATSGCCGWTCGSRSS